ncbi:DUF2264 domain-containing protein [Bifidobacterium sp. 82T10]|uniref:DUF2264 domain-containing protein n=1 Tax=Bifidobacterium miconis TaxID=2834435 RepID=A0ABS6WEJ6_9BIFI|nr:DUF2264 domain-containing protein [Bifidobacterium miconis]MBW3092448.1 DUF2264 domain-containing protein [Bifidobacterium miconis]
MSPRQLRITVDDFSTRDRACAVLKRIIDPVKPFYSPSGARLDIGSTSTWYENDTIPMEAFSRVLWGLTPFWAGGGRDADFERIVRDGLTAGTDPNHPDYWHPCHDYDQKFCEMASIAFGMLFAPAQVWDPLGDEAKRNLADWLNEINRHRCLSSNWTFFRIIANVALLKRGMPYDAAKLKAGVEFINSLYDRGGWYSDGANGDKDYYNPFVLVTFGVLYALFMADEDPDNARRFRERAYEFGRDYIHWFSPDGPAPAFGRSQTYRFAQVAFFSACAVAGIDVFPLPVLKGIIARHLADWLNRPIFDNAGVLTIGYGYPNLRMQESYNAPGSPYWGLEAFLFLALPADHEFWRVPAAPMPQLEPRHYSEATHTIVQRGSDGDVVLLTPGLVGADRRAHDIDKYSKFAYSSAFGFSVAHSMMNVRENAPDSMLAFRIDGFVYCKGVAELLRADSRGFAIRWSPCRGVRVETTVEATEHGHVRTHRIMSDVDCTAYDCGFAVNNDDLRRPTRAVGGLNARCDCDGLFCSAAALTDGPDDRDGADNADPQPKPLIIEADPNTNLVHPKTAIPAIEYVITAGKPVTVRTAFDYLP